MDKQHIKLAIEEVKELKLSGRITNYDYKRRMKYLKEELKKAKGTKI